MDGKLFTRENRLANLKINKEGAFFTYLFILIILKNIYFQFRMGASVNLNIFKSTITSLAISMVILGLSTLIFNGKRKEALFAFDLLISILFIADTLYFKYYDSVITVPITQLIFYVGGVMKSVQDLFQITDFIYLLDIPFMFWALRVLNKINLRTKYELKPRIIRSSVYVTIGVLLLVIFIPYRHVNPNDDHFDASKIIRNSNILYFHYYDIKRYIITECIYKKPVKPTEEDRIKSLLLQKQQERRTLTKRFRGAAKGKNLIMVQVESLQQLPINRTINGQEITPFLNRFLKENVYFNNFYYQIAGGNTSDAEFMTNTSLYPLKATDGVAYVSHANNKYYSLANILNQKGYITRAYHGYKPSFWNRENMYKNYGFQKFMSINDFNYDEKFGMGVADDLVFKQSVADFPILTPFYSFIITLSSHNTFSNFADYNFNVGEFEGTRFGNYIKACNYDDKMLESFIKDLQMRGFYDNSLIVIYGDHNGIINDDMDQLKQYLGVDDISNLEWDKMQKVPCIIHIPGQKKGITVSHVCGDIDILPTIANLMDFDVPYAMGRDMLNTKYGYAIGTARNNSIVTDKFFYTGQDKKVYDINTSQELDSKSYKAEIDKYKEQYSLSNVIIKKDVFNTMLEEQKKGKK